MSRAATHFESPASAPLAIEEDFHGWLTRQAALLRSRDAGALDWEHLAEEIEAMASAERRELLRRLTTLFAHLLKMQYQPEERRFRSRKVTIDRSRLEIERILRQSPGLRGQFEAYANEVYPAARRQAALDIGLERKEWAKISSESPWTLEQLMDPDFFPEDESDRKTV
jgi:hypothetical protein